MTVIVFRRRKDRFSPNAIVRRSLYGHFQHSANAQLIIYDDSVGIGDCPNKKKNQDFQRIEILIFADVRTSALLADIECSSYVLFIVNSLHIKQGLQIRVTTR